MSPGSQASTNSEIALLPAWQLARMIREREISSRELLEVYLERIDALNPQLNAVVTLDADGARRAAAAADEATTAGQETGPLHGLPMTVKDAIEVAGMRSTGGSRSLADHVPAADAPAVARLRSAGAVVMGKTNVPEWSGDVQTYNELFGVTNNPWDLSLTPGGSSGGPAAAVASGLTSFETGTDIGGSIRIPSSFCGICGHKPSYGIVSQRGYLDRVGGGVIDADINVFGPLARSVEDLSLLLDVLAGPDEEDSRAWSLALPPPRHSELGGYRVGLWLDDPTCSIERSALARLEDAAQTLADAGAQVANARPPLDLGEVHELAMSLLLPAVSVSTGPDMGPALGGNHREWLDHTQKRAEMRRVWAEWFRSFDVLLCPVMPMLPFPHDTEGTFADRHVIINGRSVPQAGTLAWTLLVGVAYLPSTVVPVGPTSEGLPVGIQIVGPYLEDRTSLFVAEQLCRMRGGVIPPNSDR